MTCTGVAKSLLSLWCLVILNIASIGTIVPVYVFPSLRIGIAQLIRAESNHRSILFMQTPHEFDLLASHSIDPVRYTADG